MVIKKMELKKLKLFEEMSEETNCYVGVVYINGKPAIEVKNDGHGGCYMQYPMKGFDRSIIDVANEFCKKSFPATVFLYGDVTKDNIRQKDILYADLETWCGDQIQEQAVRKEIKRLTTNKVSFVDKGGEVYSISTKTHPEAAVIAHIKGKYENVTILNGLAFEEQAKALMLPRADRVTLPPDEAMKIPA